MASGVWFDVYVCDAMNPWINKCIKEDKKFEIRVTAEYIMKVIAGCDLLLVALAPEMISLFAPHEYYEAVWIIPPVGISILFGFMYSFFAVFEFYYERTRGIAVSSIVSAVMNIILNYIFIQKFGYIAAGYTTLFCYAVYCLCHYFAMRKIELDYFEGMRIYNIKYLLGVPVVVIFIGLFLMTTFKMFFVRYVFVIICTYFVLQNLNKILFLFKRKTY